MSIQTSYLAPQSQWLDLTGKVLILRQNSGAIAITTGFGFGWGPSLDGYGLGRAQHGGIGTSYNEYILLDRADYDLVYQYIYFDAGVTFFEDFLKTTEFVFSEDLDNDGEIPDAKIDRAIHYSFDGPSILNFSELTIEFSQAPSNIQLVFERLDNNGDRLGGIAPSIGSSYFIEGFNTKIDTGLLTGSFDGINYVLKININWAQFYGSEYKNLIGSGSVMVSIAAGTDNLSNAAIFATGMYGTNAVDEIYGSSQGEEIFALGGNDYIESGLGNDVVDGGDGADYIDAGAGDDDLNGGASNDYLYAGSGDDIVDAGAGDDIIIGGDGEGDDTYIGGSGIDTIKYTSAVAGITVNLALNTATSIAGNDASHIGNDNLSGIENIISGNYDDNLVGDVNKNVITGNAGNDTLDGGLGGDLLIGGSGNDTYILNDFFTGYGRYKSPTYWTKMSDQILEDKDSGIDTVRASLSYSLGNNLENLTLTGTANVNGTGNKLDNTITGNAGKNVLNGGAGNDTLNGGAGSDKIYGGSGNDILGGYLFYDDVLLNDPSFLALLDYEKAYSVDKLYGGLGDDLYVIDRYANTPLIYEYRNQGVDTILGDLLNYTINDNVENYVNDANFSENGVPITITITGNNLDNIIKTSPTSYDSLSQILTTLDPTNPAQVAFYGMGGNDTLISSSGNDILDGGAGNDVLIGGDGSDNIIGRDGNDVINGGSGNDILEGNKGADLFVFDAALNSLTNLDVIVDFASGSDKIQLSKSVFDQLSSIAPSANGVALDANDFLSGSSINETSNSGQHLLYNSFTGVLYYDADGNGANTATQIALIGTSAHPNLSAADFLVVI